MTRACSASPAIALRIAAFTAGPALLLLIPLIAMRFTGEVNWTAFDFAVAGGVFCGAGFAYAALTSLARNAYARAGIGAGVLALVLLFWAWAVN